MWYGFVVRDFYTVTQDWTEVEQLVPANPYASFRKFKTEAKAWEFVNIKSRAHRAGPSKIVNYGETVDDFAVNVTFTIMPDALYVNIVAGDKIAPLIRTDEANISITKMGNVTLIKNMQLNLAADSLRDRAVAIHEILRLIGPLADVNIVVEDMSTFFLLRYKGTKVREYVKLRDLIQNRLGRLGVTVECPQYVRRS